MPYNTDYTEPYATPADWADDDIEIPERPLVSDTLADQLHSIADTRREDRNALFDEIQRVAGLRNARAVKVAMAKLSRALRDEEILRRAAWIVERNNG